MDIQFIYGVFDKTANTYLYISTASCDAVAKRNFYSTARLDPRSAVATYPNDFSLFALGEFNLRTGVISAFEAPNLLCPNAIPPEVVQGAMSKLDPAQL